MWGTEVTVKGRIYFVMATPDTPDSRLLQLAMHEAEEQERAAREADPNTAAYRAALTARQGA